MVQSTAECEPDAETGQVGGRFCISFDVVVTDPQALWHAAARIAFQQPGIFIADVEDVLGPAEDPTISDCLTMLTAPDAIAGCIPMWFSVELLANSQFAHSRARAVTMDAPAMRDFAVVVDKRH